MGGVVSFLSNVFRRRENFIKSAFKGNRLFEYQLPTSVEMGVVFRNMSKIYVDKLFVLSGMIVTEDELLQKLSNVDYLKEHINPSRKSEYDSFLKDMIIYNSTKL